MTDATRIIAICGAGGADEPAARARPGLSVAADHHERAVRRRRSVGRDGARRGGRSADGAGPAIVIENVAGAGAARRRRAARARPTAYTISAGNWEYARRQRRRLRAAYDLRSDFEPVSLFPTRPT